MDIQPEFGIVETMLIEKGKFVFYKEHLERLKHSAAFFGFIVPKDISNLQPSIEDGILRLVVYKDGNFDLEYKPLFLPKSNLVKLSDFVLNSQNTFLYHKTTYRPWYKKAIQEVDDGKYYDVVFCNEKGELCEGARSNLFIAVDDIMYTPSLSSGLLNGVLRQKLIETQMVIETKIIPDDLKKADVIYCGNSVRGLIKVELEN